MRFNLFLAVAARQCFLEIAKPRRAASPRFSRHRTVNHLSLLRAAFLNTRLNAAASSNRLSLRNRYSELPMAAGSLFAVVLTACETLYGVSLARPFARRRLRTRRPAFVAMRARKPCERARLILLG